MMTYIHAGQVLISAEQPVLFVLVALADATCLTIMNRNINAARTGLARVS